MRLVFCVFAKRKNDRWSFEPFLSSFLTLLKTNSFCCRRSLHHSRDTLSFLAWNICLLIPVFTSRCYASAVLAMALCPSVCPSQVGVLLKRLNVGSHKQHHTIVLGLQFSEARDLREIPPGSPPTGAPNAGGVGQNRRLSTNNRLYLENGTR